MAINSINIVPSPDQATSQVVGKRSLEEAEEYRKSMGIMVQAVRGRAAPKPFQPFQEKLGDESELEGGTMWAPFSYVCSFINV
jgi:hypothetical protein